ncbi:MAG: aldehyde ferredoxin oxidoreductase C-terminal domain-containing protein [Bacillota bacterium]
MHVLRVDMTTQKITCEPLPDGWELVGGRALVAKVLCSEVPPQCEPLGAYNRLVLAVGPLARSGVPCAERLSAGAKSPLTQGIKESNAGGVLGYQMAAAGMRAIIIEGRAVHGGPYVLHCSPSENRLVPVPGLSGRGVYAATRILKAEFGDNAAVAVIGPAGEFLMAGAGIFITDTDGVPGRACGRGGLGAVMGAKGLKAVVVGPHRAPRPRTADPAALRAAIAEFLGMIRDTPQTAHAYPTYGTAGSLGPINALGGLPTRNFTAGSFEQAAAVSGEVLRDLIASRGGQGKSGHRCMPGCVVKCSNVFPDADGKPVVAPLEYETIAMLGPNLGIADLDTIAQLNHLANDVGVDTIEAGVALGMLMGAGRLAFGDGRGALALMKEIGEGTVLGRVLGNGAAITGRVLGITRIPAVKGQGFPAHEPRGIKGMISTYALSPMGADHTAAVTFRADMDHHRGAGHTAFNRTLQVRVAGFDSLGMCLFVTPAIGKKPALMADLINAVHGTGVGPEYLMELGKETLKHERAFNLAAGCGPDRLPEFMAEEAIPPFNLVADAPGPELESFWEPDFWGPLPVLPRWSKP